MGTDNVTVDDIAKQPVEPEKTAKLAQPFPPIQIARINNTKGLERTYPTIKAKTLEFYNFKQPEALTNKKPFIVQLDEQKVKEATKAEQKHFVKNATGMAMRVGAVVLVVGAAIGLFFLGKRLVYGPSS